MRNALIMAAGKGTRMKSKKPKVLHTILEEPLIELVLHTLKEAGAKNVISIVGYGHEEVEKVLQGQCEFALQKEQLGTGHAVMQALPYIEKLDDEDVVIVASGDCPCVRKETYESLYDNIEGYEMCVLTMVLDDPASYGRVVRDGERVKKIVEFKDASEEERQIQEVNTGIYAFKIKALKQGLSLLSNANAQHEYYLTDLVEILQNLGYKVKATVLKDPKEASGINDKKALAEVAAYLQERINTKHMENGVTLIDPRNTYISPFVTIGENVTIYPNNFIAGRTEIGNNVVIYANNMIKNAKIESDSEYGKGFFH